MEAGFFEDVLEASEDAGLDDALVGDEKGAFLAEAAQDGGQFA
jgi:hypothetical protein